MIFCVEPYVIERYYAIIPEEKSSIDFLAILALIVSIISMLISYYVSFLNKKLDVKLNYFTSVSICSLDNILLNFNKVLEDNSTRSNQDILHEVNNFSSTIDSYIVSLGKMYYKFQMRNLVVHKEAFCDLFFDNPQQLISDNVNNFQVFQSDLKMELFRAIESQFSIRFVLIRMFFKDSWVRFFNNGKTLFLMIKNS